MCLIATILVLFVGSFLNQNGRKFRLHYVTGPIVTVGVTCTYDTGRTGAIKT